VAIVAIALSAASPFGTVFLNSYWSLSTHSGVSVDNRLGAEGAKVVGDALKGNITLTSLSLYLGGE
jgi:hypothetical protein